MKNDEIDYGMKIVVSSGNEAYLFMDMADMQRYVQTLNKMMSSIIYAEPVIGGFDKNVARLVFRGGTEEYFKKTIQKTHISYSAYRRVRKFPVVFGKTAFALLEEEKQIADSVNMIRDESEFLCTSFRYECDIFSNLHTKIIEYEKFILHRDKAEEFLMKADASECKNFFEYLRNHYELSYREIGKMFNCSSSKIYRLVNK